MSVWLNSYFFDWVTDWLTDQPMSVLAALLDMLSLCRGWIETKDFPFKLLKKSLILVLVTDR